MVPFDLRDGIIRNGAAFPVERRISRGLAHPFSAILLLRVPRPSREAWSSARKTGRGAAFATTQAERTGGN